MHDSSWQAHEDPADRLGEGLLGLVKAELDPTEYLLWANRPKLPRLRPIPLMPTLFVAVVAGLSGFALAALFGLVGQAWLDPRTLLVTFGLAPIVLGGMIAAHQVGLVIHRWVKARRLSRLIYAVTDYRAIVARIEPEARGLSARSLCRGEVVDTRRFENPDGSGDLYFLGRDGDSWLPLGFLEVPQVSLVEDLARESLLDTDQDWWKLGAAGLT